MDVSTLSLPAIAITPKTIWLFLAFLSAIYFISTMILDYHWNKYGRDDEKIKHVRKRYVVGSVFFLLMAFGAAFKYTISIF